MKNKIFVNPAIYIVFLIAVVGVFTLVKRILSNPEYVNNAQMVATFLYTTALLFAVFYLAKYLIFPFPIKYNKDGIIVKKLFGNNVLIKYQDILKVEYYNRYSRLIINTKYKKYKFNFLIGMDEFKRMLKKKVKDVEF
ncbi:MAG: hypothetical protein AB7V16_13445 [Vulcanibacillus sp.]